MEANGLISRAADLPSPVLLEPLVDLTRRVWDQGDQFYRWWWWIRYRDGSIRQQYELRGETVFQTLFAKVPHLGVDVIRVLDFYCPTWSETIPVPEGAEVDIVYDCRFDPATGKTERIFNFGYRTSPSAGRYFHIDPRTTPPRFWWDQNRFMVR